MLLLSHANQFFFITSWTEWSFLDCSRPDSVCTNLIRFFPSSTTSVEMNVEFAKKSFYFYKFAFEILLLVNVVGILLKIWRNRFPYICLKFFFGFILVTLRSRYDNVGAFGWWSIHTLSLNCVESCYFLRMCQNWIYIAGIVNFVKRSRRFHGFIIPLNMKY